MGFLSKEQESMPADQLSESVRKNQLDQHQKRQVMRDESVAITTIGNNAVDDVATQMANVVMPVPFKFDPDAHYSATTSYKDLSKGEQAAFDFLKRQDVEGYQPTAKWDRTALRLGHGSDTMTMPDGSFVKVKQGMSTTPEKAARDLVRRVREFRGYNQNVFGKKLWDSLHPVIQRSLISFYYQQGHMPDEIKKAVRSGNPKKISNAIKHFGDMKARRKLESDLSGLPKDWRPTDGR